MKKLLLSALIAGVIATPAIANENMQAHEAFKANLSILQSKFYRSLRIEEWVEMGFVEEDFYNTARVLANGKTGLVDLNNEDTDGHWTYEFTKIAQEAELVAKATDSASSYDRAAASYLVASYPNLHRPNEIVALDKAIEMYIEATRRHGIDVVRTKMAREDGRSIDGLLHIPKTKKKNIPAVMWSGGVDKTMIEHRKAIKPMIEAGYAVLTFDMPGSGTDYKNHLELGNEKASHVAAFNYLKSNGLVDNNRIGVVGSSGSGPALMDFALHEKSLKAVIARCSLVNGPISKADNLEYIPRMSADSFIARIGGDIGDMEYFKMVAPQLSLKNKGLLDGKAYIDTPLLAINTKKDPIAMPEDVKATAAMSTKGEVFISDEFGHCPDSKEAQDKITSFILENV